MSNTKKVETKTKSLFDDIDDTLLGKSFFYTNH